MESVTVLYVLSLVLLTGSATVKGLELCRTQQAIQLTEFGQEIFINSPQYPDPYVTSRNCTVSINVALSAPRVVHIEQLATNCYTSYHIVSVDDEKIASQYPTCTGYLQSTDVPHNKDTTNEFKLLLQAGAGDGFNLSVIAYPLLSMEPTDATVNLTTTPTTYITTHQGFPESFYSNNLHNSLTLSAIPSEYVVVIEVLYIRLGSNLTCQTSSSAADVFVVSKIEEKIVIYECGDVTQTSPHPLVIDTFRSTNSLLLEFNTDDSQQYQGFLLRCTAMESERYSSSTMMTTDSSSNSSSSTTEIEDNTATTVKLSEIYTAAIGASCGGVILVAVFVVLACVLYRRSTYGNRHTSNSTAESSPQILNESITDDKRTNDRINRHPTHVYCDVDLPTQSQLKAGGDSQPAEGRHTGADRGEPDGVDINVLYSPIAKLEKIEMVENSLYGSA